MWRANDFGCGRRKQAMRAGRRDRNFRRVQRRAKDGSEPEPRWLTGKRLLAIRLDESVRQHSAVSQDSGHRGTRRSPEPRFQHGFR